jgi:hypothetical protein
MKDNDQPVSCVTKLEHFAAQFVIYYLQTGFTESEAIDNGFLLAKAFLNYEKDNPIQVQ